MDYISLAAGILIGIFLGSVLIMFYIRWRMKKQLGMMEEQMGDIMDMTDGMAEDLEAEEVEIEKEEDKEE